MIKLIQKISTNGKKLVSGDFRVSDQSFVGILGDKNKFYLLNGEHEFLLDLQFKHPEIRFLTYDLFLIIDYGAFGGTNAWIVSERGKIEAGFFAGHMIEDVLVTESNIVVTYFDEGIFSGKEPDRQGLAFFDKKGAYIEGYLNWFGSKAVTINDCYAACVSGPNKITFCAYSDFECVTIDLSKTTQEISQIPEVLNGSSAISLNKKIVYFFSPYQSDNSVFSWTLGSKYTPKKIGRITWPIRGLFGGKFFAFHEASYFVWEFSE